jgi:hypothetical protein
MGSGIFSLVIGVVSWPVYVCVIMYAYTCVYVCVCMCLCVFMCVHSFLRRLHFYVDCLHVQTYQFNISYQI